MAFDGSGNFAPPSAPTFPAVAGTTISSSYFNTIIQELCNNGLSLVLPRDGQAAMTGDLDMGTNQLINVGDPASAQHAVTKAYFEANALLKYSGIYSPDSSTVTSHGLLQFNSIVTNILEGLGYWKNDGNGPTLDFMKSRGAAVNAQTIVQNNDVLGLLRFYGSDGVGLIQAAHFYAASDGTPGVNDMPTRFVWSLTADGDSSPTERMRLSNAGKLWLGITNGGAINLAVYSKMTGGTTAYGVTVNSEIQTDVTALGVGFHSAPAIAVGAAVGAYYHFNAAGIGTIGAGGSLTTQVGFNVASDFADATNNIAFRGDVPAGATSYNLYMNSTAKNYLGGTLQVEGLFTLNDDADINGAMDISGALQVHGLLTDNAGLEYGWKLIPVVGATGAVTLDDPHIAKGSSNTTGGWAIRANSVWAAPVGTAITLHNDSGSAQSVTITTDTLRLAGSTATGTRTIAARGVATLWKTKSTEWMIMGAGVS